MGKAAGGCLLLLPKAARTTDGPGTVASLAPCTGCEVMCPWAQQEPRCRCCWRRLRRCPQRRGCWSCGLSPPNLAGASRHRCWHHCWCDSFACCDGCRLGLPQRHRERHHCRCRRRCRCLATQNEVPQWIEMLPYVARADWVASGHLSCHATWSAAGYHLAEQQPAAVQSCPRAFAVNQLGCRCVGCCCRCRRGCLMMWRAAACQRDTLLAALVAALSGRGCSTRESPRCTE